MDSETRACQNCKAEFTIEPEDFAFYGKIKVPPPTWCPECRLIRRMIWRNERALYKNKDCDTGKEIFSMIPADAPVKVMEREKWRSDAWNPLEFGKDYDWGTAFFTQLKNLLKEVPLPSSETLNMIRSDYCGNATDLKDCYLVFGAVSVENSAYCGNLNTSRECFDSFFLSGCELTYEGFLNTDCSKVFFSSHCEKAMDTWFSRDCVGVSNCFGCVGLRNKSYRIFNRPYSKEEYAKEIQRMNLGSYGSILKLKKQANSFWVKNPVKQIHGRSAQ